MDDEKRGWPRVGKKSLPWFPKHRLHHQGDQPHDNQGSHDNQPSYYNHLRNYGDQLPPVWRQMGEEKDDEDGDGHQVSFDEDGGHQVDNIEKNERTMKHLPPFKIGKRLISSD